MDPAQCALAARTFVADLVAADASALGFGLGLPFHEPPRPLVTACQDAGLPMFTVPLSVPFNEVEDIVNQALFAADSYPMRRSLRMQNELLTALADPQPIRALTKHLAAIVKGTAIVYEESGRIVASVGEGPVRIIWSELRSRQLGRQHFKVGRWFVLARPVVVRGAGYWLALATRTNATLADVGDPVLESAQRVFAAIGGVRVLEGTRLRAEATAIMRLLGEGVGADDEGRVWERMRGFRFQPRRPIRVLSSLPLVEQAPSPLEADSLLTQVHDEAQLSNVPIILKPVQGMGSASLEAIQGLVAEVDGVDEVLALLARSHHIGLSGAFIDLVSVPGHLRDAERAAQVAARRGSFEQQTNPAAPGAPGLLVRFEDVDLATWLLSSRGPEAAAEKAAQQLGPLLGRQDLVETAIAWLGSGLDVQEAARSLYLHPNTVRYRLRRIEEIVQAPMNSPTVIANLYLAFHERLAPH